MSRLKKKNWSKNKYCLQQYNKGQGSMCDKQYNSDAATPTR